MAQALATKEYTTFVKGLITEASPLTFPEGASVDEDNMELNTDGSRQRRLGIDYEANYSLLPSASTIASASLQDWVISSHEWRGAASSGLYNFNVTQIGDTLYIHDLSASAISSNPKTTVDLNSFKTIYATSVGNSYVETAYGKGVLFVVGEDIDPFYISYDSVADTFSTTSITIEIRDFLGINDGTDVDNNPASLTDSHKYNLYNRGWSQTNIDSYYTSTSTYPSRSQIWYIGKDSSDNFSPTLLDKQGFGNTSAPSGHFVIGAFSRDRATESGIAGLGTDYDEKRPSAVAFYASRVFYSGVPSTPKGSLGNRPINGTVYFSQILNDFDKSGYCYQEADPSSEEISDLVDTDGGTIEIPEAGNILKLIPVQDSLFVFATNGVWQISGGDIGFTATQFQVLKVTNVGTISAKSIANIEGVPIYWSDAGIYVLRADTLGRFSATNITQTTIQSLYLDIPSVAKENVSAVYDTAARKVKWLYNDTSGYDGATYKNKYNRELIYDIVLNAFYTNTFGELVSNSPYVSGYALTPQSQVGDVTYDVVVNGDQVQVNAVDVQMTVPTTVRGAVNTKYLTVAPQSSTTNKYTFSILKDTTFTDWVSADSTGIDYSSYLTAGYELAGDTMRDKASVYLVIHFNRTETGFTDDGMGNLTAINPSSCLMRIRWEWSNSSNSGRWSTQREAYRLKRLYLPEDVSDPFDYGFSVITTKNKIRGKGRALSLRLDSSAGKDMQILGWGIELSGATRV